MTSGGRTRANLPVSSEDVARLIAGGESDSVEFKREWYDLQRKEGKAFFVKDVLALANTIYPDTTGFLLVGVDDDRKVVGIQQGPDAETISNIIAAYVQPPANVQCRAHKLGRVDISVVTIQWSPARPHHSIRDHPGILASNVVYVRRDRTVGTATLPEIEVMIREKDARLGPIIRGDPIQFGFVERGDSSTRAFTARVTNVTTEPVGGVDLGIDVRNARNPELFYRGLKLSNATLEPGQSREVEFRLSEVTFYLATFDPTTGDRKWSSVRNLTHLGDWWLDITLHVNYRSRDGFIRHLEQRVVLSS